MNNKIMRFLTCITVSIFMMLGMFQGMYTAVFADEVVKYDLWVGGIQVTSENADNITGDDPATASYDDETKTLILNNANITTGYAYELSNYKYGIYYLADEPLNIVLEGSSSISGLDYGIYSYGEYADIDISGDGTLTVTTQYTGISCERHVTIESGTVNVTSENGHGIYADQDMTIKGGIVKASGEGEYSRGLYADNDLVIEGGTVTSSGTGYSSDGIYSDGNVTIKGGDITAIGDGESSTGIYAYNNITIDDGSVTAASSGQDGSGIYAVYDVIINGGTIAAIASNDYSTSGITAGSNISINGGEVLAVSKNNGLISKQDKEIKITGGTVNIRGKSDGIWNDQGVVAITGGEVTVFGDEGSGICAKDITIGKDIDSTVVAGGTQAFAGYDAEAHAYSKTTVKNAIAGTGWEDYEGTGDGTAIEINSEGQDLFAYRKAEFIDTTKYPLWVGGTRVTIENAANITGGDTVTASYDKASKTLTLNGYSFNGVGYESSAIYAEQDLTIKLAGENTLTGSEHTGVGVDVEKGSLTVTGDGKLDVTGYRSNIYCENNITVDGGNITVKNSEYYGIVSDHGNITVNDGNVTAEDNYMGIATYESGNITVNGGNVNVIDNSSGINSKEEVIIAGGSLTASKNVYGIVGEKEININDGSVTVNGSLFGIYGKSEVKVNGGSLKSHENNYGIVSTTGGVTISGGEIEAVDKNNGIMSLDGDVTIGEGIKSLIVAGEDGAINGDAKLKNAVAGTGWTDTEGTEGKADIVVNTEGAECNYKKVVFPSALVEYPLWVSGIQVTNVNASNITESKTATASYDPNTKTLTLNNYSYTGEGHKYEGDQGYIYSGIYAEQDLTIIVNGTCSMELENSDDTGKMNVIWSKGDLTIKGDGELSITSNLRGFYARGDLTVESGTVNVSCEGEGGAGLYAIGDVVIKDGTVEADYFGGSGHGIYAFHSITIAGGNVTGSGSGKHGSGLFCYNNVTIEDGTVNVFSSGEEGSGIFSVADVNINGGTVTAICNNKSSGDGITAYGNIVINGGKVTAFGRWNGIFSEGDKGITINGGRVAAIAGDGDGIYADPEGKVTITGGAVIAIGSGGVGICGAEISIGKDVETVAAAGTFYALANFDINGKKYILPTVKNAISGVGWTDYEGTEGKTEIDVNEEGQSFEYKVVQFPANVATVTTAPTANNLTYTGEAQELVTAGEAEDGVMVYALGTDTTMIPTEGWSESIPTGTASGTYYVWYKAAGEGSYVDSIPASLIVVVADPDYSVISGDGATYIKGTTDGLTITFKSNSTPDIANKNTFAGIKVDDKDVDPSNYGVEYGSVIITLKPAYLETLSVGKHTLTAMFKDPDTGKDLGSATAVFTVSKKEGVKPTPAPTPTPAPDNKKPSSPDTTDPFKPWLWGSCEIGALAMMVLVIMYRKKKYA